MDIHQKISVAIFGSLLIGTLTMYGTGGLSSSVLKSDALQNPNDPCPSSYMAEYAKVYQSDKESMIERQKFIGRNCGKNVVEARQSYCDAYAKQLETYSALVKRYEACLSPAPTTTSETATTK